MKKAIIVALATLVGLCQFGCSGWEVAHDVAIHISDLTQFFAGIKTLTT